VLWLLWLLLLLWLQAVVRGHPDAFTGKTFVFSGVLSSLFRDVAKDLVLSHGGRVTGVCVGWRGGEGRGGGLDF